MNVDTKPRSQDLEQIGERALPMTLARSSETGLALLFQAQEYACQLNEDPWEFAVEIDELKSAGMTVNDLRWLLFGMYAEHAIEVAAPGGKGRKFKHHGRQRFSSRSCFILTPGGATFAAGLLTGEPHRITIPSRPSIDGPTVSPVWDPVRHELCLDGRVVKRFKQHSPNQEAVLMAFEEEHWPAGVLDPLSPIPNHDSKQRLRDTIKNLNRHQIEARIHFSGDGSGERILWEVAESA